MRTRANHPTHRRHAKFAAALALAFTLLSCSHSAPREEPGTLIFLIETMPTNLDPRIGTDAFSQHMHDLIFSSLIGRDAQMNFTPDLATSWETPDPLTYIFHLRHGVRFHNGAPLTSADVKFTFDSILQPGLKTGKRGAFHMVASVEAPDDYTIVFHLREAIRIIPLEYFPPRRMELSRAGRAPNWH